MPQKILSIVSPLFNEEENIAKHYLELCEILKKLKYFDDYEIIMINDGSHDQSLNILKKLAKKDKHLKIISFIVPGFVLKTTILSAR